MIAQLILIGIYVLAVGVGGIWFWKRSHLEPISRRHWKLALSSVVYGLAAFIVMLLYSDMKVNYTLYPFIPTCNMVVWIGVLFVPLWCTPYLSRGMILYYNCRLQQVRMNGITNKDLNWLLRYRFINSTRFWFCIQGAFAVFSVIIVAIILYTDYPPSFTIPNDCVGNQFQYIIAEFILAFIFVGFLGFLCYRVEDGMRFKIELAGMFFSTVPLSILFVINTGNQHLFDPLPAEAWLLLIIVISYFWSIIYPIYLSYSHFYRNKNENSTIESSGQLSEEAHDDSHQIVPIASLSTSKLLEFVFRDEVLLIAFKKFAAKSWCVENVFFYQDARRYTLLEDSARESEARRMMSTYFEYSAPLELNLDQGLLNEVMNKIQRKEFSKNLFSEVEKRVHYVISNDTLRKWRLTEEFFIIAKQSTLASFVDFSSPEYVISNNKNEPRDPQQPKVTPSSNTSTSYIEVGSARPSTDESALQIV